MKEYILRVIDFETTGIPSDDNKHSLIEAAYVDINAGSKAKEIKRFYGSLVVPTTDMDIEALATHHITVKEATEKGVECGYALGSLQSHLENEDLTYVAHNAKFEQQFFNPDNSKWIDTYKIALKLYPDSPRHTNQVLKYYLGVEDQLEHHPPHRALPDCYVTAEILRVMSEKISFNEMIQISKEPPYLTKIGFGKHRGEKFEDLPQDYLHWLSRQLDMDDGVKAAVERVLS